MPKDVDAEKEEKSRDQEEKAGEALTLSSNVDKSISIVPHVSFPRKLKDPVSLTIPCSISSHFINRALCDNGVILKLKPLWDERGKHVNLQLVLKESRNVKLLLADMFVNY